MPYFRLATLKRWAYDASIVDPGTVTDLECDACGDDPSGGDCTPAAITWNAIDATPAGWAQIGTFPDVDLGNLTDEFETRCTDLNATRAAFGNWTNSSIAGDGVQCIGIKYVFSSPCTITKAACRFETTTGNTKASVIYVKIGSSYTMLSSHFDGAPADNPHGVSFEGLSENVDEIHFAMFSGSGNPGVSIQPRVLATAINAEIPAYVP